MVAVGIECDVACGVGVGLDDSDDDDAALSKKREKGGCASAIF